VTTAQASTQPASLAPSVPAQVSQQAAQELVKEEELSAIPSTYYVVGQPFVYWQLGQVDLANNPYFYPSGSDSDKDS